jgi:predicted ATP-binding protein involved in virulence
MSGFKLIAIKTLDKCVTNGKDFLKVLSKNTIYPIYSSYTYPNNNFDAINYENNYEADFYNSKNDININISAIVGSNGSGKSTLIELLLMANYNLGAYFKMLKKCTCDDEDDDCDCNKEENHEFLKPKKGFSLEILYLNEIDKLTLLIFKDGKIDKCSYLKSNSGFSKNKLEPLTKKDLEDFCYSIVVNYSHHALNSKEIGYWINQLFHKNDGYQTPIVINPMRNDGIIDINRENELLNDRLLSNLLEDIGTQKTENSLRNLANNKIASDLKLTLNKYKVARKDHKYDYTKSFSKNKKNAFLQGKTLMFKLFKGVTERDISITFIKDTYDLDIELLDYENDDNLYWGILYLHNKSYDILKKYPSYKTDFEKGNNYNYFQSIKDDKSHIAFKFKRAIYFLKYYDSWKNLLTKNSPVSITEISELIVEIKKVEKTNGNELQTIELLPPSFFDIEIILENGFAFDSLSSGEKQKIHSVSSIVYHLINLNSVESKSFGNGDFYLKYKNVNIILDEIELYYHPEWQRRFINDLISYISKVNPVNIQTIKGLNFILITHSPFILSDIPHTNILFLERKDENDPLCKSIPKKNEEIEPTLGANIHDLLIDTFFMTSTIGEYSKDKINEFVKTVNNVISNRRLSKTRLLIKSRKEVEEFGGENFIRLIGDPLVRDKVFQLYCLAIENNDKDGLKKYYEAKLNDLN